MFLGIGLFLFSSLWIIYQDVKDQTIPTLGLALFVFASLLHYLLIPSSDGLLASGIIGFIFICSFGLFYFAQRKVVMGWGDLILAPACGLWLSLQDLPLFFFTTGLVALFIGLFWQFRWGMRTFPFAPALLLGLIAIILIRCFLTMNGL